MIALAVSAAAAGVWAQVELRGGESAPAGDVVTVAIEGVTIESGGTTLVLGWDRVRAVRGEHAGEAEPFMPVADRAWRARIRLERGDAIGAEPLLEELFELYRGRSGPTALVVAEGLTRCRIARGAHVSAIEPWLAWRASSSSALRTGGEEWSSRAGLAELVDTSTGLVPSLPPMWLAWPSVSSIASSREWLAEGAWSGSGPTIARLASLYRVAARFEVLGDGLSEGTLEERDVGTRLVAEIVASRAGDEGARQRARAALRARLTGDLPPWQRAWIHAAIGRSLVRESDGQQRRLGVVELLRVPALTGEAHPYLAGLALAEGSAVLRELGDDRGADTLLGELAERYPDHPALAWPPLSEPLRRLSPGRSASLPGRSTIETR